MLRKRLGTMVAVATLSTALGCGGSDGPSAGTCDPTVHTTADPQRAADHCLALVGIFCGRGFGDCSATFNLAVFFSSVEECTSIIGSSCAQDNANSWYDAPCGAACVQYAQTAPCSLLEGDEPQACAAATGSLPIPCTATIGTGTISDTISVLEPLFDGGHARAYCIAFSAGQSVTIQTSAPTAGTPIFDTVLHLLAPSGAQIAQNDDDPPSLYSRISTTVPTSGTYQIVVRGFSSDDLGGYELTVTTP